MKIRDIYRCLIEGRGVCTSDSEALSLLLNTYGLDSRCVITSAPDDWHKSTHQFTAVEIGGQEYIMDATTLRTVLENGSVTTLTPDIELFTPSSYFKRVLKDNNVVRCVFPSFTLDNELKHYMETKREKLSQFSLFSYPYVQRILDREFNREFNREL